MTAIQESRRTRKSFPPTNLNKHCVIRKYVVPLLEKDKMISIFIVLTLFIPFVKQNTSWIEVQNVYVAEPYKRRTYVYRKAYCHQTCQSTK